MSRMPGRSDWFAYSSRPARLKRVAKAWDLLSERGDIICLQLADGVWEAKMRDGWIQRVPESEVR